MNSHMQVEIYIDEQRLDTYEGTSIAETKQINDFFQLNDIQTSYTPTFKLPLSDRNKKILGAMSIAGNKSLAPYRVHKVSVYREGIQTISEGIGYFKPTNNHFNMFVYNDNIALFQSLKNKTLADLNLASLDHELNIQSWLDSFNRTDYTYAIADYGNIDSTIEIDYQIPSLFVKYLWNKIFNESAFKWKYYGRGNQNDFNPFIKEEWNELAITIDEGIPKTDESISVEKKLELEVNKTSQYLGKTITFFGRTYIVQELIGEITEYVRFSSIMNDNGLHLFGSSVNYNRSRIRIKEDGFYKINISGNFYNLNTENAAIFIEKDGYNLFTINDDFPDEQSSFGFSKRLYLKQGDEIFVKVVTTAENNESHYSFDMNLQLFLDNSVAALNFSSYLSKVKQTDFIKDVMQHYGLMVRNKNDVYEFTSFEELLDPLAYYFNYDAQADDSIYDDWSNKFHRVVSDNSKVGSYAQSNIFSYQYDNAQDTFANAQIKVDDETLPAQKTIVERLYKAPTNSTVLINGTRLRRCYFYNKEFNDDGSIKDIKPNKTTPYFFKVKKIDASIDYKISGAIGNNSFSGKVPIMSFDGLDFNNILPQRYTAFSNMLNFAQTIQVEVYLSVLDIHNLNFFRLKYFKQLGSMYYLSKPIKFVKTGITKVELIRVRSFEKLGEFSDDFHQDFNI